MGVSPSWRGGDSLFVWRGEADLWNSSKIGRLIPDRYIGTGPLYIDGSLVYRLSSDRLIVEIGRGVGSEVKIG